MKLCECDCGQEVTKEGNRFLKGHWLRTKPTLNKGIHRSDAVKENLRILNSGIGNPFYGKYHTKKTRDINRMSHLGIRHSEEQKRKIHDSMIGRHSGEKNPFWGKHHSEEVKRKIGESCSGDKHPRWKGGKSFEPYSLDWTKRLKTEIRDRDKHVCQLCGEVENGRAHSVHHVDYNKKNCSRVNLITLCLSCHMKTNECRDLWCGFFNMKNVGRFRSK